MDKYHDINDSDTSGTGVVRFEKLNYSGADTLIIVDGLSYPFRYKSSTFEELTSLPSSIEGANHVINFQNHLFVSNGSEIFSPHRLMKQTLPQRLVQGHLS